MALSDILTNPSDFATGILGVYRAADAANRAGKAYAPTQFDAQYQQLSQQLQALTGQLADSSNPEFQSRVSQKTDQIMQSYEQALRSQQAREAQRYSRTGMGAINPERRDEGLSRSLAQARVQAEQAARMEVTNEMLSAAKATGLGAQVTGAGANREAMRQFGVNSARDKAAQVGISAIPALMKGVNFKKLGEAITGGPSVRDIPYTQQSGFDMGNVGSEWNMAPMGAYSNPPGFDGGNFGATAPNLAPADIPYTQQPGFDVGNIGAEWEMPAFDVPTWDMFSQPDFTAGYY